MRARAASASPPMATTATPRLPAVNAVRASLGSDSLTHACGGNTQLISTMALRARSRSTTATSARAMRAPATVAVVVAAAAVSNTRAQADPLTPLACLAFADRSIAPVRLPLPCLLAHAITHCLHSMAAVWARRRRRRRASTARRRAAATRRRPTTRRTRRPVRAAFPPAAASAVARADSRPAARPAPRRPAASSSRASTRHQHLEPESKRWGDSGSARLRLLASWLNASRAIRRCCVCVCARKQKNACQIDDSTKPRCTFSRELDFRFARKLDSPGRRRYCCFRLFFCASTVWVFDSSNLSNHRLASLSAVLQQSALRLLAPFHSTSRVIDRSPHDELTLMSSKIRSGG